MNFDLSLNLHLCTEIVRFRSDFSYQDQNSLRDRPYQVAPSQTVEWNLVWADVGEYGVEKKTKSKSSWTLFFFSLFPPYAWDPVFSEHLNWQILSLSLTDIFQDQGSGYSPRVSSASLYGVSPVKIPSKCWGWSNLGHSLILRLWTMPHSWI